MFYSLSSFFPFFKPKEDLSFGLLKQYRIEELVQRQEWAAVENIAAALSGDELSRLLDGLCLTSRFRREITSYIKASDHEFSLLTAGAWHLYQAWQARTAKVGAALSRNEVQGFEYYLNLAAGQLRHQFMVASYQSEAQARLIRTWMGFSEKEEAVASFRQSTAKDPHKFLAHHHLFKVLSPKWLGDQAELLEFIDWVSNPAMNYALRAMYLVEVFSDYNYDNDTNAHQLWYHKNRILVDELLALPTIPVDNSLLSIYANNNLAYIFHLTGRAKERNSLLDLLGSRITPYPWAYFGLDSKTAMLRFRKSGAFAKL